MDSDVVLADDQECLKHVGGIVLVEATGMYVDRIELRAAAALTFVARKENVVFLGPSGVGKTISPSREGTRPPARGSRRSSPPLPT